MGGINFLYKTTHIPYTWANAVNISVYNAIGDGTNTPTTPADVRTNLGLPTSSGASYIGNNTAGGSAGSTVQAALDFKAPLASPSFTGNVHSAGTIYADATGTAMQTAGNIIVQGYVWAVGQPAVFDQFPGGFASTAGHFSRNAGSGAGPQPINGPMFVHDVVTSGATSFEWNQLNLLENSSGVGENVSFYAQAYKKGAGSTWAGVFEAHDTTHTQPSGALFCLELDMSANGSDISPLGFSQRYGVLLVGYRDDGYFASFSGRISGTTMTIDTMYAGSISKGSMITTSGVTAGTWVTAFGSGSGQAGTYTVNNSQTVTTQQLNTMQPIATGYVGTGSDANVTASITTTVLTVTAINGNGIIAVGMTVVGITSAVTAGTVITSLGTGTGGTGTYNINNSQTVASSTIELGAVANAVLTITAAYPSANNFGAIYVGASVFGRGLPDGTTVASFGTGSGGTGTYNLTIPANLWQSEQPQPLHRCKDLSLVEEQRTELGMAFG